MLTDSDKQFLKIAYDQAKSGFDSGGCPIGSVLARGGQEVSREILPARLAQEPNQWDSHQNRIRILPDHTQFSKTVYRYRSASHVPFIQMAPLARCNKAIFHNVAGRLRLIQSYPDMIVSTGAYQPRCEILPYYTAPVGPSE